LLKSLPSRLDLRRQIMMREIMMGVFIQTDDDVITGVNVNEGG